MNTIWIVPLEPIDQRYTKQWFEVIPKILQEKNSDFKIVQIDVEPIEDTTTKGAFLDFAKTNIYKSRQMEFISKLFNESKITSGDRFLFTDAWHFGIPQLKYMSQLLNVPVEIHAIWHAGSYDSTDILGMKLSKSWSKNFEKSIYYACTFSYFATHFHERMFRESLQISSVGNERKTIVSGQPHNKIVEQIHNIKRNMKYAQNSENSVIFPHRLNSDKQPEIFDELFSEKIDSISHHKTQKFNLTKEKYYEILCQSKMVFSCAKHENLGISMMEGVLAGCIPIVPDRASYSEMYLPCFKYPSLWTFSLENFKRNKYHLIDFIAGKILLYDHFKKEVEQQKQILIEKYLNADIMIENILRKE